MMMMVDILVAVGAAKSKSEARRLVESGGVYWNWERVHPKEGGWSSSSEGTGNSISSLRHVDAHRDLIGGRAAVLSVGKKRMFLIFVE